MAEWIEFPFLGDARGSLVALEGNQTIPFSIRRVYYLFGTKQGVLRGFHAHRKLEQVVVCLAGSCRMVLDNGTEREDILLDSPARGLLIPRMVWREIRDFTPDCILLVLASEHYDEADYVRDYEQFRLEARG